MWWGRGCRDLGGSDGIFDREAWESPKTGLSFLGSCSLRLLRPPISLGGRGSGPLRWGLHHLATHSTEYLPSYLVPYKSSSCSRRRARSERLLQARRRKTGSHLRLVAIPLIPGPAKSKMEIFLFSRGIHDWCLSPPVQCETTLLALLSRAQSNRGLDNFAGIRTVLK